PLPPYPLFSSTLPPTTESSTLSLHDALPIYRMAAFGSPERAACSARASVRHASSTGGAWLVVRAASLACSSAASRRHARQRLGIDRKSTRLNSSHRTISYAVFCLKKKNKIKI